MDISVIGAGGAIGREIVAQLVAGRVCGPPSGCNWWGGAAGPRSGCCMGCART